MHYIMNKNTPTIEVETAKILEENMCPLALHLDKLEVSTVFNWIRDRAIPFNRANSGNICKAIGIEDRIELMYITHSLSINDNFWIADSSEVGRIKYENISLFRNSLNNTMYLVALKGTEGFTISDKELSAEYTGQGTYPKCFKREPDGIYLYKAGSTNNIKHEVYVAYIANILGFKSAQYEYTKLFGIDCTKSKILSDESVNWETAFILCEYMEKSVGIPQDFALRAFTIDYCNMIIFDAIVLNEDRHMKNWAFEVDANTNKIIGIAPSFDYNNCFIANRHTMSNLIFDGPKKMNILRAAREAYRQFGTTLNISSLYYNIDKINISINMNAMKNRLEYITGIRDTQRDCY